MPDKGLGKRVCPLCDSARSNTVIQLGAHDILKGNWSYQPSRFAEIGIDPKTMFSIEWCSDCGFSYAGVLPSHDFLTFVYDQLIDIEAARHESFSAHNIAIRMEYMAVLIRLVGNSGKVLDFGCGFGPSLSLIQNIDGLETFGFETSAARALELGKWHPRIASDIDTLCVYGPFNAIILDNVLEHVPDPRQTINLISSICADGAFLYVSVPDASPEYLKSQITLNKSLKTLGMDINPWEHLNYFDSAHLDDLMHSVGFVALKQAVLPSVVDIGLRPDQRMGARLKNALASMVRCGKYVLAGNALQSVNRRFYQFQRNLGS
jgi:SAM-dependent methyltransferase